MEDGRMEGREQLLAKILWRCGRYSLVGRRKEREGNEGARPRPLPKSELGTHFEGAVSLRYAICCRCCMVHRP